MIAREKTAKIGAPIPCTTFYPFTRPYTICLHTLRVCKVAKNQTLPTKSQTNPVFATNCYDCASAPEVV